MKENQKLLLTLLAVLAIFILFYPYVRDTIISKTKIMVTLDYGDKKQSYQVKAEEEQRVWSLLQQATALSSVDLEATNDFRPQRIDGYPNGKDSKEWKLYVNEVKQEKSPFEIYVKSPDKVVFRFE